MTTETKRHTFDGFTEVCCHRVFFWFFTGDWELSEDLQAHLIFEANQKIREGINVGYWHGAISAIHDFNGEPTGTEICGWWAIKEGA